MARGGTPPRLLSHLSQVKVLNFHPHLSGKRRLLPFASLTRWIFRMLCVVGRGTGAKCYRTGWGKRMSTSDAGESELTVGGGETSSTPPYGTTKAARSTRYVQMSPEGLPLPNLARNSQVAYASRLLQSCYALLIRMRVCWRRCRGGADGSETQPNSLCKSVCLSVATPLPKCIVCHDTADTWTDSWHDFKKFGDKLLTVTQNDRRGLTARLCPSCGVWQREEAEKDLGRVCPKSASWLLFGGFFYSLN